MLYAPSALSMLLKLLFRWHKKKSVSLHDLCILIVGSRLPLK